MSSDTTSDSFFDIGNVSLVDNTFTELTLLSESSSGYCRLFRAKRLGKWFVLKCLKAACTGDPALMALLNKEFAIGYALSHPNIARIEGLEEVDGLGLCIIMEYVDGSTMRQCLERHALQQAEVWQVCGELCDALSYLHGRQVIHRDLKPSNVMLTSNGHHVKLIDFGLSDTDDYAVFKEPAGTRRYAAPEQFDVHAKVDARADIYALGLLIGELNASLPHPSRRLARVSARCSRPDRDERYASVSEVAAALRRRSPVLPWVVVSCLATAAVFTGLWLITAGRSGWQLALRGDVSAGQGVDTVYITRVDTVIMAGKPPVAVFEEDALLDSINTFARTTTLGMMQEMYDSVMFGRKPRQAKEAMANNIYFDIEKAIRKGVDELVAPSTPQHSIYLNAALTVMQVTWRDFNLEHSQALMAHLDSLP